MTRHARTVILLGGWLLMFPPSTVLPGAGPPTTLKGSPELKGLGPSIPDLRAPLSQWTQAAAFDTAKECEGAREELLYFRDDGHSPAGLYRLPLVSRYRAAEDEASLVARTAGSPRVGSFDPEGGIVFDSVAASVRRRAFDDIHHLGPHETSQTGRLATR